MILHDDCYRLVLRGPGYSYTLHLLRHHVAIYLTGYDAVSASMLMSPYATLDVLYVLNFIHSI